MVDDEQVRAPGCGLAGDLDGRVDGEQHLRDLLPRVAVHEPHGVVLVGGVGRVPPVHQVDDVAQGRHAGRLVGGARLGLTPARESGMAAGSPVRSSVAM